MVTAAHRVSGFLSNVIIVVIAPASTSSTLFMANPWTLPEHMQQGNKDCPTSEKCDRMTGFQPWLTTYWNKFQVYKRCECFSMSKKIHATCLHWSLHGQVLQYLQITYLFHKHQRTPHWYSPSLCLKPKRITTGRPKAWIEGKKRVAVRTVSRSWSNRQWRSFQGWLPSPDPPPAPKISSA